MPSRVPRPIYLKQEMPKKTAIKKRKTPAIPEQAPEQPARKIAESVFLTKPLGLLGWDKLEPVLLAALATSEPLLLIGKHGTAKSFLLERLAQALGLAYRFYNASLVNYDDLVGIPVPDATQTSLRYISTPTAIWDAEVVFIDELNRTRPDLQNKLFSIIHERRVQGVPLEKLRYRWAAMNPPPADDQDPNDVYLGAEPLDPALADRFGFLIEVPDWCDLIESEKKTLLFDQFKGRHEFPINVPELVKRTEATYQLLCGNPPDLGAYFVALETQLRSGGTRLSPRRIASLFRTSLGIHAARIILSQAGGEDLSAPDWDGTLFLAIEHGHPGQASGAIDRSTLLAFHRQAWNIAGLKEGDPWKELLNIADPLERVILASRANFPLSQTDLSSLVLEAVSSQRCRELCAAVSLALYLRLRTGNKLAATAAETLASQLGRVIQPVETTHQVYGTQLTLCREVANLCSKLGSSRLDGYTRNLLNAFLPDGFSAIKPAALKDRFETLWSAFGLDDENSQKETRA